MLYQFLHADDLEFSADQRDPMGYKYLSESGCLTIDGKGECVSVLMCQSFPA